MVYYASLLIHAECEKWSTKWASSGSSTEMGGGVFQCIFYTFRWENKTTQHIFCLFLQFSLLNWNVTFHIMFCSKLHEILLFSGNLHNIDVINYLEMFRRPASYDMALKMMYLTSLQNHTPSLIGSINDKVLLLTNQQDRLFVSYDKHTFLPLCYFFRSVVYTNILYTVLCYWLILSPC